MSSIFWEDQSANVIFSHSYDPCYVIDEELNFLFVFIVWELQGCSESLDSFHRYDKLENRISRVFAFGSKGYVYGYGPIFIVTAVTPISYVIFQYPPPDQWAAATEYSWVQSFWRLRAWWYKRSQRLSPECEWITVWLAPHSYHFLRLIKSSIFDDLSPCVQSRIPLPNDTNVFVQYYADWVDQLLCCGALFTMLATTFMLLIGLSLYIGEMLDDLRETFADLSNEIEPRRLADQFSFHNDMITWVSTSRAAYSVHYILIWSKLFTVNFFDSIAKSLADIMSAGIFFQLLVCGVSLAIYMVSIEDFDIDGRYLVALSGLLFTLIPTYICCKYSEQVTHNLSIVGDVFFQAAWYRLSVKRQQLFLLPIQSSNTEFRMKGFQLIECSLSFFASVRVVDWENQSRFLLTRCFSCLIPDYTSSRIILSNHTWIE